MEFFASTRFIILLPANSECARATFYRAIPLRSYVSFFVFLLTIAKTYVWSQRDYAVEWTIARLHSEIVGHSNVARGFPLLLSSKRAISLLHFHLIRNTRSGNPNVQLQQLAYLQQCFSTYASLVQRMEIRDNTMKILLREQRTFGSLKSELHPITLNFMNFKLSSQTSGGRIVKN